MPRWRDVKRKNINQNKKDLEKISRCNVTLMNRFKSFVTDVFMLLVPIVYIVMYIVMGDRETFANEKLNGWFYILFPNFIVVISFLYFKGQTPGMKAYGMRLISFTSNNKFLKLLFVIIRYVGTLLTICIPFLWFIPFFNKEQKTFQDYISRSCLENDSDNLNTNS